MRDQVGREDCGELNKVIAKQLLKNTTLWTVLPILYNNLSSTSNVEKYSLYIIVTEGSAIYFNSYTMVDNCCTNTLCHRQ